MPTLTPLQHRIARAEKRSIRRHVDASRPRYNHCGDGTADLRYNLRDRHPDLFARRLGETSKAVHQFRRDKRMVVSAPPTPPRAWPMPRPRHPLLARLLAPLVALAGCAQPPR